MMRSCMSCWSKVGLPRSEARNAFPASSNLLINDRSCWSLAVIFQSPCTGSIVMVASAPCTAWTSPPCRRAMAVSSNWVASSCGSAWSPSTFKRTSLMYRSASARCRAATLMTRAEARSLAIALALKPTIAVIKTRKRAMIQPKVLLLRTGFSLALVYYLKLCVHSSQVMAFQIAEEDVLAWRQADDELCSVANVEFAQLVDPAKLRGILVHPE